MSAQMLLMISLGLVPSAAPEPKKDAVKAEAKEDPAIKAELEKFQGAWMVTALEEDGVKQPESETKKLKVVFKGDKMVIGEEKDNEEFTFKIDPSKNPKAIDLVAGDGKQNVIAIYEFDGETLRICGNDKSKDRPKTFGSKEGSGLGVLTLKKAKS